MSDDEDRLEPARPEDREGGGKAAYMPRFPWRWVLLGLAAAAILGGGYYYRQQSRENALRQQIREVYDQRLGTTVRRYRGFRSKLEGWIMEVAEQAPPEEYVDPRLKIAGLHDGQGLYLRIRADQAETAEGIEEGARSMGRDAITRCLGIAPISARGFYEKGEFLMPGWIDRASEDEAGMMRLRVIDDELARFTERDLPAVMNAMQSQYFLLAIQQGENRRDAPVDVYMWDLRGDRRLLAVRTEAEGVLIPVRIAMKGAPRSSVRPRIDSGGANDCSIAAQIKELTGEPAMEFGSDVPDPSEPEDEAEADSGAGTRTRSPSQRDHGHSEQLRHATPSADSETGAGGE